MKKNFFGKDTTILVLGVDNFLYKIKIFEQWCWVWSDDEGKVNKIFLKICYYTSMQKSWFLDAFTPYLSH